MSTTVHTGWRTVTPGACLECGFDDDWECDGRGNVLCSCQACPDCGIVDAYGFHNAGCPQIDGWTCKNGHRFQYQPIACPTCTDDAARAAGTFRYAFYSED